MNIQSESKFELTRALVELARELPPSILNAVILALESNTSQSLWHMAATPSMREKLRRLEDICARYSEVDSQAVALALRTAVLTATTLAVEHRAELAWTGPVTEVVPVRRVDQAIYDLMGAATEEVLLVTFAAYKAEKVLKALRKATDRGVRVRLVIELAHESGGKISFDGLQALQDGVPRAEVFYWPLDRRSRTATGKYGAMHAKCIVADRRSALVSSANLTDYALEMNMELGIVVEGTIASRLAEHFDRLVALGELIAVA